MDFAEQSILENQIFQKMAKFIMADSYEMDFVNGVVILVKINDVYNILNSASQCLLVER